MYYHSILYYCDGQTSLNTVAPDSSVGRAPVIRYSGGLGSNFGLVGHYFSNPITLSSRKKKTPLTVFNNDKNRHSVHSILISIYIITKEI